MIAIIMIVGDRQPQGAFRRMDLAYGRETEIWAKRDRAFTGELYTYGELAEFLGVLMEEDGEGRVSGEQLRELASTAAKILSTHQESLKALG